MQRSQWAERFAATFASIPLVSEFVLPNPEYLNKVVEQEVCDFVLMLRTRGIVCQMKAQEEPEKRTGDRLERWIRKTATEGASQVAGALATFHREPTWCDHSRRGRIDFAASEIATVHGVVLVECSGARVSIPDVSLEAKGVPLTYMDASDFLNVVDQLRSFPDIDAYLAARATIGDDVRRSIGHEKVILEHFVLNNGTFANWTNYADALRTAEAEREARDRAFAEKIRQDREDGMAVEEVAHRLASRAPDFAEGLNADTIRRFDDEARRERYLLMQEDLADLTLSCRRRLGAQLRTVQEKVARGEGERMSWAAVHFDVKPNFAYVVVASRGIAKQVDYDRALSLLAGAIAYFGKRQGLAILDRGTGGYEILTLPDHDPSEEMRISGERHFGKLRMHDGPLTLMP